MSFCFVSGGEIVWFPALRVGLIYMRYVGALENEYGVAAGFAPLADDMVAIDPEALTAFVSALTENADARNKALELELKPVLLPAIVMLQRAGAGMEFPGCDDLVEEARLMASDMPN